MAQAKKRKRFFDVEIPLINRETSLQGYTIEEVDGRYIKYDLTRFLKGKSVELQLVVKVTDGKAVATPRKLTIMPYFIRRVVRKGTNYIEDSFPIQCEDATIRIKPFLVTRRKVSRAVRTSLRNKAKEELIAFAKNKKMEDIFAAIILNKIQRPISLKLKKIYPLSFFDVRALEFEKKKTKREQ